MRVVEAPVTLHRTASNTNETHAITTIVVVTNGDKLGPYPPRTADGRPKCTRCGIEPTGVWGYCCPSSGCPLGCGPVMCG